MSDARRSRVVTAVGTTVAMLLCAGLLGPTAAYADGDPASDVLLAQSVFFPYESVPAVLERQLSQAAARTSVAGRPLKVAVIATRRDLGSVSPLYEKPQEYAHFLEIEISFSHPEPLVVVMPRGYGTAALTPAAAAAITKLPVPPNPRPVALVSAAIAATNAIAATAPIGSPATDAHDTPASRATSNGGPGTIWIALAAALIVLMTGTAAGLALVTRRTRRT